MGCGPAKEKLKENYCFAFAHAFHYFKGVRHANASRHGLKKQTTMKYLPAYLIGIVFTAITLTACGPGKDRVRIQGKLDNITNAEFYVYSEDGTFDGMDTIRIEDGEFTYERKLLSSAVLTLLYPNYTQTYIVAEPGKTIKLKGDASKIGEAEVTGTEENEILTEFRLANLSGPESNHRLAAAQFIRDHAKTLAAVAVYRRYFTSQKTPDVTMALQLLDVLKKAQPASKAVTYLDNFYRPIFNNGVGKPLPDFKGETLDGKTVSSADYKGKRLVIACAATWQGESIAFLRQLRKKLKSVHPAWECIIVSMDVDREVLRNTLKRDSLEYPVICDRKAFESPLVQQLGLHYVPSCMLIDAQGKIIQRDVMKVDEAKLD